MTLIDGEFWEYATPPGQFTQLLGPHKAASSASPE